MKDEHDYEEEFIDPNNLIYLRNRYYDPNLGVFLSRDPYEGNPSQPMSLNQYAYVEGNPVNKTDPSGLCASSDTACLNAVQQLESTHGNVYMYWPERVPGRIFTYPTLTPSATNTPTATPTATYTPSPTATPTSTFTPTPTLVVCPTPSLTSTPTGTPTNTSTPTITLTPSLTPFPTVGPTGTPLSQLTGLLETPKAWQANEVAIVKEALDLYVAARGVPMFPVVYVRSDSLSSSGRTIGDNTNPAIHPTGANVTVLLGDVWSNLLNDQWYGKWIVVHENNHAFLWINFGAGGYDSIGKLAHETFVIDPSDSNVFPTAYAAKNYDTRTEYLTEAMTGLLWDITRSQPPGVNDHNYQVSVSQIKSASGETLEDWIHRLMPSFIQR
jgi:RHS repeat-associated protein